MTSTRGGRPSVRGTLLRHFFASFFRLSFLDDAGEESLKRALLGSLVATVPVGLFITRLYATKYMGLAPGSPLRDIVGADRIFGLSLPMFATACAVALALRSVFPDDIDFRTLMPLPVPRRTIFFAKLLALGGFVSAVVLVTVVTFTLPLALVTAGHIPNEARLPAVGLQSVAAMIGSLFAAVAIVASQGMLLVVMPRRWRHQASIWLQTALVSALVFALPFVLRASALWRQLPDRPWWLRMIPPAWFWAGEEYVLGARDTFIMQLAAIALVAVLVGLVAMALCTAIIYRRFDGSALRLESRVGRQSFMLPWRVRRAPAGDAVRSFIAVTLRRSGVHQLLFWAMCSAGAAMAVGSLSDSGTLSERWVIRAALSTPFTMMAGTVVGLRMALLLPANIRAGWVFRFLEVEATRGAMLDAVRESLFVRGALLPTVATLPLVISWTSLETAPAVVSITLLIGWAFTEMAAVGWRRVPFTCTYLFGRRPPAYTVCLAVLIFGWFVGMATTLANIARAGLIPWAIVVVLVSTVGIAVRIFRRQNWGYWPFEFEDFLPNEIDVLRLGD